MKHLKKKQIKLFHDMKLTSHKTLSLCNIAHFKQKLLINLSI